MSRIPPHATCVFKGVLFDVYQWQQEMFEGTVETFEALKRPDTVEILALQGGEVLYAEQSQPVRGSFLSLFGGRVEEGETALQAARRELREESGLASETWVHLFDHDFPGKIVWRTSLFIARDCREIAQQQLDSGERIAIRRAPLDVFLRTILPRDDFHAHELKREVFSAFDPARAARLTQQMLGS